SSGRGELSPQRRRIDLGKPPTPSKLTVAKVGVTIDFFARMRPEIPPTTPGVFTFCYTGEFS
ncbi:hypothetical protein, partial [Ralstonia pseudosolanacearum]